MAYADVVLGLSPEIYWRLGDAVSSTDFTDETANVPNEDTIVSGTVFGNAGILTGDGDTCAEFDGSNDYLTAQYTAPPTAFTITAWIEPDVTTTQGIIVWSSDNAPSGGTLTNELAIENGILVGRVFDGATKAIEGATSLSADTIYFIALTAENSGDMNLYLNAVTDDDPVGIDTLYTGGDYWRIGGATSNFNAYFNGKIDEIAIWHTVLSAGQISDLYEAGTTAAGGNRRRRFFMAAR